MRLTPGTRLGPYEIVAPLGAGGMGEVFRARDTRLGRDVAIKVLPQHLSAEPEVRARFEREAKTISSLNHPHICTLFDVGNEGGTDYLVMELVDGGTLADRLATGPIPTEELLKLGAQIADALDRAHRAGVIHRDLKPGNVMLTRSGAKLMDFGLARATGPGGPATGSGATLGALTHSPTVATPLTAEGAIVGTFQYMAPEQLEGGEADERSDLWALGCVLYEMATGRRAFDGKSQASLISAIMASQPAAISQLAPASAPGLERLIQACLAKDPAERLQSAHDIRMQLEWLGDGGSQAGIPAPVTARARSGARRPLLFASGGWLVAVALLLWQILGSGGAEPEAIQSLIEAPIGVRLINRKAELAISPDGRSVAFAADDGLLYVRPLGSDSAMLLRDTDGAYRPFWSPDSRTIAYFSSGKLMRVPAAGGSPTSVCDAYNARGGSWGPDGTIVFAPNLDSPLMRVSSSGGEPTPVTTLDETRNEAGHRFPYFLPDGEHFLFATLPGGPDGWDTYVGSLSSPTVKHLLRANSVAIYAAPGYLLFEREGRVLAQRFDVGRLELEEFPVAIADAPEKSDLDAEPVASASQNGRLAILRSERADASVEIRDPSGATKAVLDLPPAPWQVSSVSPDGRQACLFKGDELWVVDLERSVPMLFATNLASDPTTVWSPDADRIAYVAKHDEREEIYIGGLGGRAELIPSTDHAFKFVDDWSSDGRSIVFNVVDPETNGDLWILPLDGDRTPVPYLQIPGNQDDGRISPDGRWLAYQSSETGAPEIYVQSFPEPARKIRISLDGGVSPRWSKDGSRLYFYNFVRREFFEVSLKEGPEFQPGSPRKFGSLPVEVASGASYPDESGALVSIAAEARPRDIRLILDWTALLGP